MEEPKKPEADPRPEDQADDTGITAAWQQIKDTWRMIVRSFAKFFWNVIHLGESTDVEGTINGIREGLRLRGYNIWILICSAILASIGLNVSSPAVIIGAMLISPLMSPILGIGLSIGINDRQTLYESFRNFGIMVVISLLTSFIYFLISPLKGVTEELASRTHPTILDLGVAFFGGVAGIVAGSRKEKTNAIPGVAIATALMPPICTAGYGLANISMEFFLGAIYLFFLNAVFISLSTFLIVRYLRFPVVGHIDPLMRRKISRYVAIFVIVFSIPSMYLFYDLLQDISHDTKVKQFLTEGLDSDSTHVVEWRLVPTDTADILSVSLTGASIPKETIDSLDRQLAEIGLDNTHLMVIQTKWDPKDLRQLNQSVEQSRLFMLEMREELISRYDYVVSTLNQEVSRYKRDSIPFGEISNEIKAVYPDLTHFSVARMQTTSFDTTGIDTMMTFVVSWNNQVSRNQKLQNESQMNQFLKFRLAQDTVRVVRID